MKKIFLIILGLMYYLSANPTNQLKIDIFITKVEAIKPYDKIWNAVCQLESRSNPKAYNKKEQATGIAQIRPIRLKDFNQRTGKEYTINDCFNVEISREIFMYYASKFNPDDVGNIAKDWNKCKNNTYWNKVEKIYNNIRV